MMSPSQEEASGILGKAHSRFLELVERCPDAQLDVPSTIDDGAWSVKDLVGHIAAWQMALDTIQDWRQGLPPRREQTITGPESVDRFNGQEVTRRRQGSVPEIRLEADGVHAALAEAITGLSEEEWAAELHGSPGRRRLGDALGRILGAPGKPFGHIYAHLPDLEAFLGKTIQTTDHGPGREEGPAGM